jgi:serine/threonine protein kinase
MTQWLRLDCSPLGNSVGIRDWLYREIFALVSAVSFLHREIDGIVTSHHDLKPDNILWLGGSLKICDLGRSHLLPAADGSETEGRAGLGTFSYQPPEYYNDDGTRSSRKHGRAFDVWSLGCILLEMATLIVYGWQGRKIQDSRVRSCTSLVGGGW